MASYTLNCFLEFPISRDTLSVQHRSAAKNKYKYKEIIMQWITFEQIVEEIP